MFRAVYPGSFDPVTNGHIDIVKRASNIVDHLIIAVLKNSLKKPIFSLEERIAMLKQSTGEFKNIEIKTFDGLLVDFALANDAKVIIRGLRAVTDFENEFKMALTNRAIHPEIETLFISTSTRYLYLSSSVVKEIASFGGNIDDMVHPKIKEDVLRKMKGLKGE